MITILYIVAPIFALVGIGYSCCRLGWLPSEILGHLNRYVFILALPALLLKLIWGTPAATIIQPSFAFLTMAPLLATFCLGALATRFGRGRPSFVTGGFAASNVNAGIIGIPLCLAAFGNDAAAPAALTNILTGVVLLPVILLLFEWQPGVGTHFRQTMINIARNPLFASCMLGLLLSLSGLPLPAMMDDIFGLLGSSAMPCALVALGIFLAGLNIQQHVAMPLALTGLKLVIQPLLVLWLAGMLAMPLVWKQVAVLMAATPTANGTFLIVNSLGRSAELVGQTILLSTVLGVLTMPVWLYLLAG